MKEHVFLFHHQTKTDLKFMWMLVTQNQNSGVNLSCVEDRVTTNLISSFGKGPVSIKSLFNMEDKSLFLTILWTSIYFPCGSSLTLFHNSAYRALLNIFSVSSRVSTANRLGELMPQLEETIKNASNLFKQNHKPDHDTWQTARTTMGGWTSLFRKSIQIFFLLARTWNWLLKYFNLKLPFVLVYRVATKSYITYSGLKCLQ